jgi:membrane-bound metal-dependent hydrolase YbcI (DUF457 family)
VYAGHFAAGLAIKAKQPEAPTWALLMGVGFLDVLFGIFVMLGVERVSLTPGQSPGFSLDYIDWSHSLAISLVWAALFSMFFWRRGRAVALAVALAVFSHFLLDWPMHPSDLALWPNSSIHVGLGLWRSLPVGWWFVELACIAAGCAYYVLRARRLGTFGGHAYWVCAVVLILHVTNSPWLAPTK